MKRQAKKPRKKQSKRERVSLRAIFGLGNPGDKYNFTRHNIGFLIADEFAKLANTKFTEKKYNSLFGKTLFQRKKIIIAKPQTYMNLSGLGIKALALANKIDCSKNILIVCDDVNLEFGTIRFRQKGSSGGHNGLQSVIDVLGTENFSRLRIGIGGSHIKNLSLYVLQKFNAKETESLPNVLCDALMAIKCWIKYSPAEVMNKFDLSQRKQQFLRLG